MEIVGVVAAVPELVKLVKRTGAAVSKISSKARTAEVARGVQIKLDLLAQILESIHCRLQENPLDGSHGARLAPVIRDTQEEVVALQHLVDKIEGSNGGPGFIRRAQFVLTGFEKQFNERAQRIDSLTNLLQIYLSESTIQSSQKSRLRTLLRPQGTEFIPRKLEGTAEWIWSHEAFTLWMGQSARGITSSSAQPVASSEVTDRILTLYGVKGCGKSVLAASVVDGLRERGASTLFFSFWAGNDQDRRSDAMLRALLWQLLENLPQQQQISHMPRLLENQDNLKKSSQLLLEIQTLSAQHKSDIYCILDGIDESADDWNDPKGGPLEGLVKLVQSNSRMRLLLVGRQSSLRLALRKWPRYVETTSELVSDDLSKLILFELENCPNITDHAARERIRSELESKSTVMFLWIKLVFKELRLSFSPSEVSCTLSRLPDELDREYHRLFSKLMSRLNGRPNKPSIGMKRAKGLLGIIVGALRPLTTTELRVAYEFSSSSTMSSPGGQNLIDEEGIVDACGDFITMHNDLIYIGHVSVREFLLRPADQWDDEDSSIAYFRLEPGTCQRLLGLACLRYLKQIRWQDGYQSQMTKELASRYPFLNYASGYMASHLLNSDLRIEDSSSQISEFLNSDNLFAWLEFAVSTEGEGENHAMLPAQCWDDLYQFCAAWADFNTSTGQFSSLERRIRDESTRRHRIYGEEDSRAACLSLMADQMFNTCMDTPQDEISTLGAMPERTERKTNTILRPDKVQSVVRSVVTNGSTFNLRHLALVVPAVKSCIKRAEALLNPLDLLFQVFGRSLNGISFFGCMALGKLARDTKRPRQALRIYRAALRKVQDRGDLREAWVRATIGDCLRLHIDIEDLETAEKNYKKVMEVLEANGSNPLYDVWWCSAARCRVECLFSLDRAEEAMKIATGLEAKLMNERTRASEGPILREWCHNRIWNGPFLAEIRGREILDLGLIYERKNLPGDAERLMGPFVRDQSRIGGLDPRHRALSMHVLAGAMDSRGDHQEAREIWITAKKLLDQKKDADRRDFNKITWWIIDTLCFDSKYEEAEREFSTVDLAALLSEHHALDAQCIFEHLIDTHMMLGRKDKVVQAVHTYLPAVMSLFVKSGRPLNDDLRFVARRMFAYGLFEESEMCIRQMLARLHSGTTVNHVEEFYLYEALALSLRFQADKPKRPDPYDMYLACIELGQRELPDWAPTRVQIGLAMACVAADRREKAVALLDEVATACRDDAEECGLRVSDCILWSYSLFFGALARLQQKRVVEAILLLSQMIGYSEYVGLCECHAADYEGDILAVVSYLHLAEIFDGCGGNARQADEYRKKALETLRREFYEVFEESSRPRERCLDLFTLTWSDSCLSYLLGKVEGGVGCKGSCEAFPFEIFWQPPAEHKRFILCYAKKY